MASDETMKKNITVGGNFKNQLINLMQILSATTAHYIRCIKPNAAQKPDQFDPDLILAQLRYSGMLETIRIRQCGYPVRYSIDDFNKRYSVIISATAKTKGDKAFATALLEKLKLNKNNWRVGLTKVFLRDHQYRELEDMRNKAVEKKIIIIQSWWRMIMVRMFFLEAKRAVILIQAKTRAYLQRKKIFELP